MYLYQRFITYWHNVKKSPPAAFCSLHAIAEYLSSVHPEMAIFTDFGVGLKF